MPEAGKATIYSVAERAQVSIATVSRVLSGANRVSSGSRDRVLAAVRELDYIPDRAARSKRGNRTVSCGPTIARGRKATVAKPGAPAARTACSAASLVWA